MIGLLKKLCCCATEACCLRPITPTARSLLGLTEEECQDLTTTACLDRNGQPQGPGTICANTDCTPDPKYACCFDSGIRCRMLTEEECAAQGGTFKPGANCLSIAVCRDETGACCYPDGSCADLSAQDCFATGGVFKPDKECSDNPCLCWYRVSCCACDGCPNDPIFALCASVDQAGEIRYFKVDGFCMYVGPGFAQVTTLPPNARVVSPSRQYDDCVDCCGIAGECFNCTPEECGQDTVTITIMDIDLEGECPPQGCTAYNFPTSLTVEDVLVCGGGNHGLGPICDINQAPCFNTNADLSCDTRAGPWLWAVDFFFHLRDCCPEIGGCTAQDVCAHIPCSGEYQDPQFIKPEPSLCPMGAYVVLSYDEDCFNSPPSLIVQ